VRVILVILCGLTALFAGGCALILFLGSGYSGMFQSSPAVVMVGGIAALNILVIMAFYGKRQAMRWPFYVLAGLDALAVLVVIFFWASFGLKDGEVNTLATVVAGFFALKGGLTVAAVRKLPAAPGPGGT